MAHSRKHVTIDGHSWAYIEQGKAGMPKLFLLHGGFTFADYYHKILPQVRKSFHVIAPDMPGFGFTKALTPNTLKNVTRSFIKFVQHFGPEPGIIFGSSLGGAITLSTLVQEPDLFKYYVIHSPMWQKDSLGNNPVEVVEKKLANVSPQLLSFMQRPKVTSWLMETIALIKPHSRKLFKTENKLVLEAFQLIDIKGFQELYNSFEGDALAHALPDVRFAAPLLLLAGDDDDAIAPERTAALAAILGQPMVLIPGEGHDIVLESPEKVIPLIDFSGYGMTWELPAGPVPAAVTEPVPVAVV